MGKWRSFNRWERPHAHERPIVDDPRNIPGGGSVWECSCGEAWVVLEIKSRLDEETVVYDWTVYGKDFGLLPLSGLGH